MLSLLQGDFDSSEDKEHRNDRQVSPAACCDWTAACHTVTLKKSFYLIDKMTTSCFLL